MRKKVAASKGYVCELTLMATLTPFSILITQADQMHCSERIMWVTLKLNATSYKVHEEHME